MEIRKNVKRLLFFALSFFYLLPSFASSFGVFIGAAREEAREMLLKSDEKMLSVLDADEIFAEDAAKIHEKGHEIFAYINVGALENWRRYYSQFEKFSLSPYANWKNENWVDVSKVEWQDFITQTIAKECEEKGVDGFFLDNFDVYAEYRRDEIFDSLLAILRSLSKYEKKIIINGGDVFVDELIHNDFQHLIWGVCQESVFTRVSSYKKEKFEKQKSAVAKSRAAYLFRAKEAGLHVFAVEYAKKPSLSEYAEQKCEENGFRCYVSPSLSLDGREWSSK